MKIENPKNIPGEMRKITKIIKIYCALLMRAFKEMCKNTWKHLVRAYTISTQNTMKINI